MDSKKNDLNRVYLAMRSSLARIVMRLVPPREVEDIVQETYVRVCQVEKQGLEVEQPRAFLFKTARNLALDYLKRAETRLAISADDAHESGLLSTSPLTDQTFDQVASDEEFSLFCKAVRELPVQCRRVFVLKKVYGYSQREIARQLDISENTVEKHIAKGIKNCTYFMQQYDERYRKKGTSGRRAKCVDMAAAGGRNNE